MPFLAPFLPALIGAGASIGGGLLAGRGASQGPSRDQTSGLIDESIATSQQGRQLATDISPFATGFLGQAQDAFNTVLDYTNRLLSGNRDTVTETLGPEIQNISDTFGNAYRNINTLNPRSGAGAASAFTELPFRQAEAVQGLVQGVRPQAAQIQGNLATNLASLGTGVAGAAGGLLSGSQAGTSGLLGYGLNANQQAFGQSAITASGIFNLLDSLGLLDLLSGGGGGSGSSGSPYPSIYPGGTVPTSTPIGINP